MLAHIRSSQFLRFLIAGACGVALYYISFVGLTEYIGMWYISSSVIAGFLNYSWNFLSQKLWVFEKKQMRGVMVDIRRYAILAGTLLVSNCVLLYLLVEYAHWWYLFAQVVVTIVLSLISFFATRALFTKIHE